MEWKEDKERKEISYLVSADEKREETLETRMLLYNDIPGLLPMHYQYVDEQVRFVYDVQGMASLQEICRKTPVNHSRLYQILDSVIQAVCAGEAFFLQRSGYCIQVEWMFWDRNKKQVRVCYVPKDESDFEIQFQRLLEFLLECLDHREKGTVAFLYGLYDLVCTEGVDLNEIRECLYLWAKEGQRSEKKTELSRKRGQKEPEGKAVRREFQMVLYQKEKRWNRKKEKAGICSVPKQIILNPGEYQIGRGKENEICLSPRQISRDHAKIHVEGTVIYIEDCGSANGTYVNGKKISAHVKTKCLGEDVITFADISYQIQMLKKAGI